MIELRDGLLALDAPYDEGLVAAARTVPGRRWDPEAKVWTFPLESIRVVLSLAETFGVAVTPEVESVPDAEQNDRPEVGITGGRFIIAFPYDPRLVERVREIPDARWDTRARRWTTSLAHEAEVSQFVIDTGAHISPTADGALDEARDALGRIDASASRWNDLEVSGLAGELLPFQRAGIAYALDRLQS